MHDCFCDLCQMAMGLATRTDGISGAFAFFRSIHSSERDIDDSETDGQATSVQALELTRALTFLVSLS